MMVKKILSVTVLPLALSAGGIPDLSIRTAPDGSRYAEGLLRGKDGVGIYTSARLPKARSAPGV